MLFNVVSCLHPAPQPDHLGDKGKYCLATFELRDLVLFSPPSPSSAALQCLCICTLSYMWPHHQQTSAGACQGYVCWRDSTYNGPSLLAVPVPYVLHVLLMASVLRRCSGSSNRKGCLPRVSRAHVSQRRNRFPRRASNIYTIFPAPSRK